MPAPIDILTAISAVAFLFYGLACLFSAKLVAEFERYGLARWRVVVGGLEVAGALGLIAGWWFPPLQTAAAAGLFALMICGLWARWDPRSLVCHASGLRPGRDESGDCFESELRRTPRG